MKSPLPFKITVKRGNRCLILRQTGKSGLLAGADTEDLGAAGRASALGGGAAVLHFDALGSLHFFLGATLYAICLHDEPPTTKLHVG